MDSKSQTEKDKILAKIAKKRSAKGARSKLNRIDASPINAEEWTSYSSVDDFITTVLDPGVDTQRKKKMVN